MICTQGLNMFRVIATFIAPVLVNTTIKIEQFLNVNLDWSTLESPLTNHRIEVFVPLMQRITTENLENITNESSVN